MQTVHPTQSKHNELRSQATSAETVPDHHSCWRRSVRHIRCHCKLPREGARDIYEFKIRTLGGFPGPQAFDDDRSAQLFGMPPRSFAFEELTDGLTDGKTQAEFRLITARSQTNHSAAGG